MVRVMLGWHVLKGSICQSHLRKEKKEDSAIGWSSERGNVPSGGLNCTESSCSNRFCLFWLRHLKQGILRKPGLFLTAGDSWKLPSVKPHVQSGGDFHSPARSKCLHGALAAEMTQRDFSKYEGPAGSSCVSWAVPPAEKLEVTRRGPELALCSALAFRRCLRIFLTDLPHHAWLLKWQFESFLRNE